MRSDCSQAVLGPWRAAADCSGATAAIHVDGCLKEETFNCKWISHLSSFYYFRVLYKYCRKYTWEKFNTPFASWLVLAKDNRQRCHFLLSPCFGVVAATVRQRADADVCVVFLIRSDNINKIQEPLVMVKDQKWLRFTPESWQEKTCLSTESGISEWEEERGKKKAMGKS